MERLDGEVDAGQVLAAWERVVAAPDHDGDDVWFHGDLGGLNLLADEAGDLAGILDWGTCGVGDPAVECRVAWNLLPADARRVFRDELGIDDAQWERGRGWALSAITGITYYRETNPVLVADGLRGVRAVLAAPLD